MVPIYEQSNGKGIGHTFDSFRERFLEICQDHAATNRAQSFAFIFYDQSDPDLKAILKDQVIFTRLDRLAGMDLSLFYLHDPKARTAKKFNREFQECLGISTPGPCVVFFRLEKEDLKDIQVCAIDSTDVMQGFHEIHQIISNYLADRPAQSSSTAWHLFRTGLSFVGKETLTTALKEAIENGKLLPLLEKALKLHSVFTL